MAGLCRVVLGALCFLALAGAAPIYASTLTLSDAKQVSALWKKANDLVGDIAYTAKATTDADPASMTPAQINEVLNLSPCFDRLQGVADSLNSFLNVAAVTVLIASDMKDRRDEISALDVVRASLAQTDRELATMRQIANSTAGKCQRSAAINTKAQVILDFIGEIDSQLGPIVRKVQAVQK